MTPTGLDALPIIWDATMHAVGLFAAGLVALTGLVCIGLVLAATKEKDA